MNGALIGGSLVFVCSIAITVWRWRQASSRRQIQQELRAAYADALPGLEWFPIQLSRPQWYERRHPSPEAAGLLGVDDQQVRVLARLRDGSLVDESWPLPAADIRPSLSLRVGGLAGFLLGHPPLLVAGDGGSNDALTWQRTAALLRRLVPGAPIGVALERNRWSLTLVIAFFLLVLYGMADPLLNPSLVVGSRGTLAWLQLGVPLLALLLVPVLRRRLPPMESAVLPILLMLALFVAVPPLVQRIDAATARGDFVEQTYRLEPDGRFVGAAGLPPLQFRDRVQALWKGQPAGTEQRFLLRRGGLGLWQLDKKPLRERLDDLRVPAQR